MYAWGGGGGYARYGVYVLLSKAAGMHHACGERSSPEADRTETNRVDSYAVDAAIHISCCFICLVYVLYSHHIRISTLFILFFIFIPCILPAPFFLLLPSLVVTQMRSHIIAYCLPPPPTTVRAFYFCREKSPATFFPR